MNKMKKHNICLAVFFILIMLLWISCSSPVSSDKTASTLAKDSTSDSSSSSETTTGNTGKLALILKDAPIENAKNIWVTVSQIKVHMASPDSFIVISNTEQKFDLLYLKNNPTPIAQATLEAGHYNQIRMPVILGKIVFVENGKDVEYPLDVPSDEIKIPVQFEITAGGSIQIILDFDTEKSIHVVKKGKSDSYLLRPVVNVEGIQ
jgi:HKD family nuclease